MKEPVDKSQNCACGACEYERAKYQREMKKYMEHKTKQNNNHQQGDQADGQRNESR